MRLYGFKSLVADVVLDAACVLGGDLLVNSEIDEKLREQGVALVDPLCMDLACLCELEESVCVILYKAFLAQEPKRS